MFARIRAAHSQAGKWPCPWSCLLIWFKHVCQGVPRRARDRLLTAYLYFKKGGWTSGERDGDGGGRDRDWACPQRVQTECISFPTGPKIWQLQAGTPEVTGQTSDGSERAGDGQHSEWIPMGGGKRLSGPFPFFYIQRIWGWNLHAGQQERWYTWIFRYMLPK